jgi:ABC-type multidrug transport system permease subunit
MYVGMALLLGSCYWKLSETQTHIQDRISLLFFACAFLTFMSIAAFPSCKDSSTYWHLLYSVIEDRLLFVRERANGYYRVSAFALSHSLVQLPFTLIMSLSFTLIAYWMIDLNDKTDHFWYFMLLLWGGLYVSESMVTMIAAFVPFYLIGIAIAAAMFGVFMVLNGYFIKKSNIPIGWVWMHYLSFHKYLFEGFLVNEFDGKSFACTPYNFAGMLL